MCRNKFPRFLSWLFNDAVTVDILASDDKMIYACGAAGGVKFGRKSDVLEENSPQLQFVHYESHMT
jgi:hypothetical protein